MLRQISCRCVIRVESVFAAKIRVRRSPARNSRGPPPSNGLEGRLGGKCKWKSSRPTNEIEFGDSCDRVRGLSEEEIVQAFKRYDFRDELGHPLINCTDFKELLKIGDGIPARASVGRPSLVRRRSMHLIEVMRRLKRERNLIGNAIRF
jgi:hypothetical protein